MSNALDDPEFDALTSKISRERGFRCANYKEKCLRRRIAVRMRARGVHTYGAYARLLDEDAAEYDRLLDALTINVTKLFRNWEVYAAIGEKVIPNLFAPELPSIRVWSAGCSSGEEPYSLGVLFHAYASAHRLAAQLERVDILGTDIDRVSLERAVRGEFESSDFSDTPQDLRDRYFNAAPPFAIAPDIRRMVRFERHDLLKERAPEARFHVVTCRNVLIYFDRDTQERLFRMFHEAIAPGGYLILGKVETLLGPSRSRFAVVDGRERIFRKL